MKEHWIRWEPAKHLAQKYYFKSIIDQIDNFQVILFDAKNENKKVILQFHGNVGAYRSTIETFTYSTITKLDAEYGTSFYGDWTFFKVQSSDYLKWLSAQSCGISDDRKLTHFCILTVDCIIDIIASQEPDIKLIG